MNEAPVPHQPSRLRSDRDRFVAMAFCWADILVELDENEKVTFAVGPTAPLVGKSSDKLIGATLDSFIDPADLSLIKGLLAIPRKSGRISMLVSVRPFRFISLLCLALSKLNIPNDISPPSKSTEERSIDAAAVGVVL